MAEETAPHGSEEGARGEGRERKEGKEIAMRAEGERERQGRKWLVSSCPLQGHALRDTTSFC